MIDYKRKHETGDRFSLHDAHIIAMDYDYEMEELRLLPQYGFVDIQADTMVDGEVVITGVSFEDSYVTILEYKNVLAGNVGSFVGEKMTLTTFLTAFDSKFKAIDIMSTYHGHKICFITGYLSRDDEALEINMDIFYRGDFIYRVREE
ncbi:hypothetical protein [Aedoeadaptatus coli]|uniref:hypothetical protein n=1 Tax=Aedoeadaptatus coli TaxID=2058292 RepID=UPI00131F26DB|nr:hypothetical protein [Peptoniphilus coli]